MSVILALDVGERRVGVAKTDELEIIASPFGFFDREVAIEKIADIISEEMVDLIVVGMPYLPSGGLGSQAEDVNLFIEELKAATSLDIETENEVLTSVEAEKRLKSMKKSFEKGDIDAMAATVILESYLRKGKNV